MLSRVLKTRKRVFYGWWIVAAGSGLTLTGAMHGYGFSVFFLPLSQSLGLSRTATSLVFAAARLEGGFEAPIAGRLIDRFGPRAMLAAGAALAGLGYILLGLIVRDFWSFLLVYVVVLSTGFSVGFFSALQVAYNTWFHKYRATVLGTLAASNRAGAFLLVPAISFLVYRLGWQTTAIIVGVIIIVVVVPLAQVFRRSPESMGLLPDGAVLTPVTSPRHSSEPAERKPKASDHDFTLSEAMKTSAFWLMTLAQGVRAAALGAVLVHAVPMLVWKGAGRQEAANLLGTMALIGMPGALIMGRLADRLNKRVLIALGSIAGGLALLILNGAGETWHLYGFIILYAAAESTNAVMIAIVGDFFGRKHFATLRGVMQFFSTFPSFGMPVYAGWVWDRTDSYTLALVPFAMAAVVAAVLYLMLRPPKVPASVSVPAGVSRG
ncbi:MAG: MFS transporter [Chloroflexi bacterium]|nr:MFS transporter [Chloroflexota bacterium]